MRQWPKRTLRTALRAHTHFPLTLPSAPYRRARKRAAENSPSLRSPSPRSFSVLLTRQKFFPSASRSVATSSIDSGAVRRTKKVLESPLPRLRSGRAKLTPLGESGGAAFLETLSADEGAFLVEPKVREANWLWIKPWTAANFCNIRSADLRFASAGTEAWPAPVVGMAGGNPQRGC